MASHSRRFIGQNTSVLLLGLLWSIIQPLAMTLLFAFVLSNIFNQPVQDTILYIYSGPICWDVVIFSSTSGSMAFMNAAPYMKQFAHPIAIYPLRRCPCRSYQFRAGAYRFNLLGGIVAAGKRRNFMDFSSLYNIYLPPCCLAACDYLCDNRNSFQGFFPVTDYSTASSLVCITGLLCD